MQRSHDWNVAFTKMATTVRHQSPVVQQMGDCCGFPKHKPTHHTTKSIQINTRTPVSGKQARTGRKDAFSEHLLFSALADHLKLVNKDILCSLQLFPMKTRNNLSELFHIRNMVVLRLRSCLYFSAALAKIVGAAVAAIFGAASLDAVASCYQSFEA